MIFVCSSCSAPCEFGLFLPALETIPYQAIFGKINFLDLQYIEGIE